jgi:alpha-mannosidase
MKNFYPPLYARIKAAVQAGRIEPLGAFWVEPDCNMPSGESLVRQILRKSGHSYFMTQKLSWNVVNRFPHQSFHWEGIDGTSILTHMLPEETYNGPAAARSLAKIATTYAERAVSDHALMVFGIGDGGGGPDAEHLERLRRAPGLPGLPAVRIEPATDFFKTWSRDADRFPVWKGELYLERHQGTLTTQALTKRNNRRCEVALREVEWAAFLAWPRHAWLKLEDGWRHLTVPALGWAMVPPLSTGMAQPLASERRLENEHLRVEFAEDGRICSLFDKKAQREVIAPGEFANDFVVIADQGDAWDFETDHPNKDVCGYLRQPVQRPQLVGRRASVDGPCAALEQTWRIGASEIRQAVRLMSGADELTFDTTVDWRERATMLRVRFPVAIQSDEARFEIPFGSIRRSTREDTPQRLAQLEVAALQWVVLSQDDYGVALYNDCKYGFRIKGHTIDMSLIRSVPHPGTALVGKDDPGGASDDAVYGDIGSHVFNYTVQPHAGHSTLAPITAEARRLNTPLALVPARSTQGKSAPEVAFTLNSPAIELAAILPSEDGWTLRLVNIEERDVATVLSVPGPASWVECDLLGRPLSSDDGTHARHDNRVHLDFRPFEIKTLAMRTIAGFT